jgi:NADH:ubiquinone oxidoreductase subunit K
MIGMLQIITYLLCIYLVFKGVEILQIALANYKPGNNTAVVLGVLMLVASIGIAIYFAIWVDKFAAEVGNRMQQTPGPF